MDADSRPVRLRIADLVAATVRAPRLDLRAGQGVALRGPSGSGKTSLLRAIADLDPNSGIVELDGQPREGIPAPEWRRRVACVPAEPAWWAALAIDHVPAGDRGSSIPGAFGLTPDLLARPVELLSTGERQRLALAIALARQPDVLLLDEPTAALDGSSRAAVEAEIGAALARGAALLLVTHDAAQVRRLGLLSVAVVDGRVAETP
ncbi:MAG: ABC transporter ATP-binding protein [Pseudomonadota bacterium]|nr:ABC transporter ATP-binding protein [Pseudomonadota bacterium]